MNFGNYDHVLQQLRSAGLLVDDLVVGQRQRCRVDGGDREKRGWYHLHELRLQSGDFVIVGSYGIWHGNDPGSTKVELAKGTPMSAEQRLALRARMAEDRRAEVAMRKAQAARAAARAQAMWQRLERDGDSDYLKRKGIQSHGLRYSQAGTLVVPMLDTAGQIHGLQLIYPKNHPKAKRLGRDKDFWPSGLAKQGHHFCIGSPPAGVACLVAEGYATAATLYEATGLPTVVAFDAGNLLPVAEALRKRHRGLRLLVCADDDYLGKCKACGALTPTVGARCVQCGQPHGLTNSGMAGADAAALAVSGAVVAPSFGVERPTDRKGPTDFNDLAVTEGLQAVRVQIEARLRQLKWSAHLGASHTSAGSGGDGVVARSESDFLFDLDLLLQSFTLIYGTDTVFDGLRRSIVGLGPLRSAAGKSLVRMWLEHPQRRTVLPEQVGFDPACTSSQVVCNLWGGWPTVARPGECQALLRILEHLCSREDKPREVYGWVLKWLAYPIQHPGAKMQTALLFHGPEGTGKNTFFGAVRQAYDRYGFTFTQVELESQFNGIFSGKLFGIGNEVVSRAELYHQQGRMRNMITEGEWPINEKNLPARMEQNHCNMVFFSNRVDIAKLDPDDRRYCVVWTPEPASPDLYLEAKAELAAGGVAALHWHLLHEVNVDAFDEHAKPPMTRAKRELIGLGMDSTERFWREWSDTEGELHELYMPCTSAQLYQAYTLMCRRLGIGKPAQQETLSTVLGKKPGIKLDRTAVKPAAALTRRVQRCVFVQGRHEPPVAYDGTKVEWISESIDQFDEALEQLQKAGVLPYGANGPRSKDDSTATDSRPRVRTSSVAAAPADDDDAPY